MADNQDNRPRDRSQEWETWPPRPRTLQEEIEAGDDWARRNFNPWDVAVAVKKTPALLHEALLHLRAPTGKSVAALSRHATHLGCDVLQEFAGWRELRELRKRAFLAQDELALQWFAERTFALSENLGVNKRAVWLRVFTPVLTDLRELADDAGLTTPAVVVLALAAGLACDRDWLPPPYRCRFVDELDRFQEWLGSTVREARLREVISNTYTRGERVDR